MYEREMALAIKAVCAAGDFLLQREGINLDSDEKRDIKLSSDKLSEKIIMDLLKETGISILSEEYGAYAGSGEYRWIIDPLDGTVNYWKGIDELSCVSVALWRGNEPLLGVVNRFHSGELFYGSVDSGAFLNDKAVYVSTVTKTEKAIVATGFPTYMDFSPENIERIVRKLRSFKKVRMLGTAAIMGSFVAAGRFDAYIEENIKLWDIAAAAALVKSAGGTIDIKLLNNYNCICRLFSSQALLEDYDAKSL